MRSGLIALRKERALIGQERAFLWLLAAGQSPRRSCLANTQTGRMLTIMTFRNPGAVHSVHRTISSCISLSRAWRRLGKSGEVGCFADLRRLSPQRHTVEARLQKKRPEHHSGSFRVNCGLRASWATSRITTIARAARTRAEGPRFSRCPPRCPRRGRVAGP